MPHTEMPSRSKNGLFYFLTCILIALAGTSLLLLAGCAGSSLPSAAVAGTASSPSPSPSSGPSAPGPAGPTGGVPNPSCRATAYVADFLKDRVTTIDTTNRAITGAINTPHPREIAITPDGKKIYISHFNDNTITVVDASSQQVQKELKVGSGIPSSSRDTSPDGKVNSMASSPDGKTLYIANFYSASVQIMDIPSDSILGTIPVGIHPRAVAFSPDGSRAYVANEGSFGNEPPPLSLGSVSVIDTRSRAVVSTVAITFPFGLAMSPDGQSVYVVENDHMVSVLATATNTVVSRIPVGQRPLQGDIAISPDARFAYVVDFGASFNPNGNGPKGSIWVIDTATKMVTATTELDYYPAQGIAVTPDGAFVYAAVETIGVQVLDAKTNKPVDKIAAADEPFGIQISPCSAK